MDPQNPTLSTFKAPRGLSTTLQVVLTPSYVWKKIKQLEFGTQKVKYYYIPLLIKHGYGKSMEINHFEMMFLSKWWFSMSM